MDRFDNESVPALLKNTELKRNAKALQREFIVLVRTSKYDEQSD